MVGIVDKNGALIAGTMFVSLYFAGQVLNAFAEESIFRGIILPRFMRTMSFWKANLAQALLFAAAHLIWPLSSFALGQATLADALMQAAMLLVFTTIGGLLFGYLVLPHEQSVDERARALHRQLGVAVHPHRDVDACQRRNRRLDVRA